MALQIHYSWMNGLIIAFIPSEVIITDDLNSNVNNKLVCFTVYWILMDRSPDELVEIYNKSVQVSINHRSLIFKQYHIDTENSFVL